MNEPDSGHGWVRRAPGGYKAPCGGPPMCEACQRDMGKLAASQVDRSPARVAMERELQQCFDHALADTRWP